ncbi:MAG TPA: gliding motility-associated C-terminal domain-containing protein, partial [Bacteroidia bacterium]
MKNAFLLSAIGFLSLLTPGVAQQSDIRSANWLGHFKPEGAFIENKGQYENLPGLSGRKVLYGAQFGAHVYFTQHGLTWCLFKGDRMSEEEMEKLEKKHSGTSKKDEEEWERKITRASYIGMEWIGANPGVQLVASEKLNSYWNFLDPKQKGKSIDGVGGFHKLVYKDLYPNIDVEYVFDARGGIKYSLILHPGADLSEVKMHYTGAKNISADGSGNIHITSQSGEVTDHAPITFYESDHSPVTSQFIVSGNEVGFSVSGFDGSRTLIIDPWSNSSLNPSYTPTDIGKDAANNVYVYGFAGLQSFSGPVTQYVQKYDGAGTLQWTFNASAQQPNFDYVTGDIAVDPSGNSYISNGLSFNVIDCQSMKISTTGSMTWNSPNSPLLYENWRLLFNCDYTQLVQTGCSPGCCNGGSGDILNTANGNESGLFVPPNNGDMVCSSFGKNGYLYSCSVQDNNTFQTHVTCLDPANSFNTVFSIPASFSFPDGGQQLYGPLGYNGIAAGCAFLYLCEGSVLEKRDLNTGALLNSVPVPGGVQRGNSGLAVDKCGNVYVGSQTAIYVFDANLTQQANYPTPTFVTDIVIGNNGTFYACGGDPNNSTGFVAQFSSSVCPAPITITTTPTSCSSSPSGTATATPVFCSGPYTYSWSTNPVQTTQTATGLSSGTYTVIVAGAGACNEIDTMTATISGGLTIASATTTNVSCNGGSDGTATSGNITGGVGPYTYSWSTTPSQTNTTATGLAAGTYTLYVTDSQNCQGIVTVTITQPGPISGADVTTGTGCNASTGTATVTPSGGNGPYTYSWTTSPSQTGATATGLAQGNYTVFITDVNGCSGTDTVSIVAANGPTASIASSGNPLCNGGTTGTATATATGGTSPYTYSWNNGQTNATATGLSAGTYTVVATDANGCTSTITVTLTQPSPVACNTVQNNVSCFGGNNGSATATGSGGTGPYNYAWAPSGGNTASATGLNAGTYSVTVTDANNCTTLVTVTITQPGPPADTLAITGNFCPGDSAATLYAPQGLNGYQWYYDTTAINGATTDSLFITNTGNYTSYSVTWNLNGCTRVTSQVVLTSPLILFTPDSIANVFTPNGDGKNDRFSPYSGIIPSQRFIEYYAKDYSILIYDRWGNQVFSSGDINTQWDGTIKG